MGPRRTREPTSTWSGAGAELDATRAPVDDRWVRRRLFWLATLGLVACTFGSDQADGSGVAGGDDDDDDNPTTGPTTDETTSTTVSDTIPFDTGSDGDDDDDNDNTTADTGPENCPEDWWDSAWSTRVPVTITADGQAADDIPLPLFLDLSAEQLDDAAMGGADLRFIANDGTQLRYELTRGNDQTAIAWILHTHIADDVDTLWIYLGNPDAERDDDSDAVWSAYDGVWHFDVDMGVLESSASDIPGTPMGIEGTSGPVGTAQTFGGQAAIDFAEASESLFSGWPNMTLSMWLYFDYPDDATWEGSGEGHVLRRNGPVRFGRTWRMPGLAPGVGFFQIDIEAESGAVYRRFNATREAWHWFVYDYDGDNLRLYLDGEEYEDFSMISGNLVMDESPLRLGESNAFDGAADELWIGNATHNGNWYGLQYRAMQDEVFVLGNAEGC